MNDTVYFVFDVESDGLYGDAFAIGAVVVDSNGKQLDAFSGISEAAQVKDDWVIENVLPHLNSIPEYTSRTAMRDEFWQFYMKWKDKAVIAADVPCPVEAGLLRACVNDAPGERNFLAPYPLIDVASILFAKGLDPHINRMEYSGFKGTRHNPIDDAMASSLCLVKAMQGGG